MHEVIITQKLDVLTERMAKKPNVLVGDTDWIVKIFGTRVGAMNLRYMIWKAKPDNPVLALVIKPAEGDLRSIERHSTLVASLQRKLEGSFGRDVSIVTCSDGIPGKLTTLADAEAVLAETRFGLWSKESRTVSLVDCDMLAKHFAGFEPTLIEGPRGAANVLHDSLNDIFQLFTRSHLTAFVTINDFDAIRFAERLWTGRPQLIELKRIADAVQDWEPRMTDRGNYWGLMAMCEACDCTHRVIAYNPAQPDVVAIDRITAVPQDGIEHLIGRVPADSWDANGVKGIRMLSRRYNKPASRAA